jgi:hypothetical protein
MEVPKIWKVKAMFKLMGELDHMTIIDRRPTYKVGCLYLQMTVESIFKYDQMLENIAYPCSRYIKYCLTFINSCV